MNLLRAYVDKAKLGDSPDAPIRFVASTEGVKADGQDLRMEDWSLDRFLKHPVILYAHDYMGHSLPLGTGQPSFDGRDLMMDVIFDSDDEFAQKVRKKTIRGMMGASVGWNALQRDGKRVNELLEMSIVPLPMDADCLPVIGGRAMELMTELATLEDDAPPEAEAQWREAAPVMVGLFTRCADDADDAQRLKDYNALLPTYRRAGKTPPEFLPAKHVAALSVDELRGLFLAGEEVTMPEPEIRAGAMLSGRNKADLQQAVTLIQGVIDRAKPAEETPKDQEEPERAAVEAGLQAILDTLNKIG
jgi:hypothetical protein